MPSARRVNGEPSEPEKSPSSARAEALDNGEVTLLGLANEYGVREGKNPMEFRPKSMSAGLASLAGTATNSLTRGGT